MCIIYCRDPKQFNDSTALHKSCRTKLGQVVLPDKVLHGYPGNIHISITVATYHSTNIHFGTMHNSKWMKHENMLVISLGFQALRENIKQFKELSIHESFKQRKMAQTKGELVYP